MQLNTDVLCADSLPEIREIFGKITDNESVKSKKSLETFNINAEIAFATELLKAGMFETELREAQIVTYKTKNESTPKENWKSDNLIKWVKMTLGQFKHKEEV